MIVVLRGAKDGKQRGRSWTGSKGRSVTGVLGNINASLADAELAEDAIKDVVGVDRAQDSAEVIECLTQVDCQQFVT